MLINVLLLLVFLVCLAYLAMGLRRLEADLTASAREIDRFRRQEVELSGAIGTLQEMIFKEDQTLSDLVEDLDGLKAKKEETEAELQAALDAPKQRMFVFDKATLIHGKLWEVKVVNDTFARALTPPANAQEWAEGRICLVGSATDRDARYRTESRFPSSQGYRIISVERFRRA